MTVRVIDTTYWIGDIVHHKMADDDQPGIITNVRITDRDAALYLVTWRGRAESWHYDLELSPNRPATWTEPTGDQADAAGTA